MNGYLILHARFIYALTEIGSVLTSLCRVEMSCVWEITTHVRSWALTPFRSRCMMNLISLSTLDVEGYRYSGSGGVCKVSKGSLIHMIGDMNSTKLYVLRGSTLHGSVTAATVSNDEPSKTNLCHMRLGHMNELSMAELIKRDLLDGCTWVR